MWPKYSMLRTMLKIKDRNFPENVFGIVENFIKNKNKGYQPRKSEVLSREHVMKFLKEAPNEIFLMYKVLCYTYCILVHDIF